MESVTIKSPETGPVNMDSPSNVPNETRLVLETEKGIQVLPKSDGDESPRPTWLPEKFRSVEDMAKAYSELEKRLSSGQKPQEPTPVVPAADAAQQPQPDAFSAYTAEFMQSGKLSDDSYKQLESKGIPRSLVDSYIANYQAAQTTRMAESEARVVASVGGPEEYARMQVWASKNFSQDEIAAYNRVMESGDVSMMNMAVSGMKARFDAQAEPRLISARASNTTNGFRSMAEMTAAMRDPRYATDAAYRADVTARMKSSNLFGVTQ